MECSSCEPPTSCLDGFNITCAGAQWMTAGRQRVLPRNNRRSRRSAYELKRLLSPLLDGRAHSYCALSPRVALFDR